jgi:hypothetical protein
VVGISPTSSYLVLPTILFGWTISLIMKLDTSILELHPSSVWVKTSYYYHAVSFIFK